MHPKTYIIEKDFWFPNWVIAIATGPKQITINWPVINTDRDKIIFLSKGKLNQISINLYVKNKKKVTIIEKAS